DAGMRGNTATAAAPVRCRRWRRDAAGRYLSRRGGTGAGASRPARPPNPEATMSEPAQAQGHSPPLRVCENCRTALRGGYCHLCGRPEASPSRHGGHAVEEVFVSFWLLGGLIFLTLQLLWIPARIAIEYLAGNRVRYVAPMRLFVI